MIASSSESASSYFVQWALRCLPEDGKYKCLDLLNPPDNSKVEVLIGQLNPGGEIKTKLVFFNKLFDNFQKALFLVFIFLNVYLRIFYKNLCHTVI